MDLFDAMTARHSYRGAFTDAPVPREDLTRIVQAGCDAPSGCNAQTTEFVIVDDPALLGQIAELLDKPVVRTAKAIIACVVEPREVFHGVSFEKEDCAAAVENILLAVTALGYATVWLDGMLRQLDRAERIGALLGVPAGKRVQVLLPLGVPADPVEGPEKKPFAERAGWNRHGAA